MLIGFRKTKLSTQLALIVAFPLLLTIASLSLALFSHTLGTTVVLVTFLVLGVGYVLVSVLYVKRLLQGVGAIRNDVENLSQGKFIQNGAAGVAEEITDVSSGLNNVLIEIKQKADFAEHIKLGELEVAYHPPHAEDRLGHSLLGIREYLIRIKSEDQKRNWTSEGLSRFVEVLRSNDNLKKLSNEVIILLVKILKANQGALFLTQKDETGKEYLEMQACYAHARTKHFSKRIELGEGLIGQTYLEKRTVYLKKVPQNFIQITSGLGEANPNTVLIVPLKNDDEVVGVVELASFKEFDAHEISFVEKIGESIAHTIASFRTAEHTRKLLDESQEQTEHMRAQEEELRQNQEELQATQEEISRKYNELFRKLTSLNHESRFDQLRSITLTRKRSIEYYFDIIRNQILTFSENKMIIQAVNEFRDAFRKMDNVSEETLASMRKSLKTYYTNEFIPRLKDNTDQVERADLYFPQGTVATVLQYLYISHNAHPTGQKALLDNADDGSDYSRVHEEYHATIRSFLEKFGYYDIFLLDAKTGDMLYSVFKEVDYATSLLTGLYSKTNFGKVVQAAINSRDRNFVQLVDFELYDPSYRTPASFIACPVYDGDEKTGVLVFQMPINKINQILTGDNKWSEDGLGRSGETFIVGADHTLRSIARELVENPRTYLASLQAEGYDASTLYQIQKTNTSILLEKIKFESVTSALAGSQGTMIERSALGTEVLNAYAPLSIPDVQWVIMSSMQEAEISERINSLRN